MKRLMMVRQYIPLIILITGFIGGCSNDDSVETELNSSLQSSESGLSDPASSANSLVPKHQLKTLERAKKIEGQLLDSDNQRQQQLDNL